jgi:hypothetical protein
MPRVLAYVCPRTTALFIEKDDYVAHLRNLAGQSRHRKSINDAIAHLQKSFTALRETATSQQEILPWLYEHRAEIIQVACVIKPSYEKVRHQADKGKIQPISSISFSLDHLAEALVAGVVTLVPSAHKNTTFLGMLVPVLNELSGVKAKRRVNELVLHLYAEDWTFAAEKALYAYRTGPWDELLERSLTRIVQQKCPALTFDSYKKLCNSDLLGEGGLWDEATFVNWVRHGSESPQLLPESIATSCSV